MGTPLFWVSLITCVTAIDDCRREYPDEGNGHHAFSGVDADIIAPWIAAIGKSQGNQGINFFVLCSGVIISKRYILTAAHCFNYAEGHQLRPTDVILGATQLPSVYVEERKISEVEKHPSYKRPLYYYDIALITVDRDINFNSRIYPICLHTEESSYPGILPITVQGLGQTDSGRGKKVSQIILATRSKEECDYRTTSLGKSNSIVRERIEAWMPQLTSDVLFCADADLNPEVGTCRGDSGGPAIERLKCNFLDISTNQ